MFKENELTYFVPPSPCSRIASAHPFNARVYLIDSTRLYNATRWTVTRTLTVL